MRGTFSSCQHRSACYCRLKFNDRCGFVRAAKTTCVRTGLECACFSSLRALIPHDWIISAQSRRLQAPHTEVQHESWRYTVQTEKICTQFGSLAPGLAHRHTCVIVLGGFERAAMSVFKEKSLYSLATLSDASCSSYVMRGRRTRSCFWKKKIELLNRDYESFKKK